jgi:hypothetical protein
MGNTCVLKAANSKAWPHLAVCHIHYHHLLCKHSPRRPPHNGMNTINNMLRPSMHGQPQHHLLCNQR